MTGHINIGQNRANIHPTQLPQGTNTPRLQHRDAQAQLAQILLANTPHQVPTETEEKPITAQEVQKRRAAYAKSKEEKKNNPPRKSQDKTPVLRTLTHSQQVEKKKPIIPTLTLSHTINKEEPEKAPKTERSKTPRSPQKLFKTITKGAGATEKKEKKITPPISPRQAPVSCDLKDILPDGMWIDQNGMISGKTTFDTLMPNKERIGLQEHLLDTYNLQAKKELTVIEPVESEITLDDFLTKPKVPPLHIPYLFSADVTRFSYVFGDETSLEHIETLKTQKGYSSENAEQETRWTWWRKLVDYAGASEAAYVVARLVHQNLFNPISRSFQKNGESFFFSVSKDRGIFANDCYNGIFRAEGGEILIPIKQMGGGRFVFEKTEQGNFKITVFGNATYNTFKNALDQPAAPISGIGEHGLIRCSFEYSFVIDAKDAQGGELVILETTPVEATFEGGYSLQYQSKHNV